MSKEIVRNIVRLIQLNPNEIWLKKGDTLNIGNIRVGIGQATLDAFEAIWECGFLRSVSREGHWEAVLIPHDHDLPLILKAFASTG